VTSPARSVISDIEAIVVRAPESDPEDLDSSSETLVVVIRDENGRVGIGEADAPAGAVRELVLMGDVHGWSRGLRGVLLGCDPFDVRALHHRLYEATIYHGRRGLGIHALSAIDVALHDLVGKQLGRPVYQVLGGARQDAVRPYATIYPGAVRDRTIGELMDDIAAGFERALALGFRAVKMEVLFGDLVSDRELVRCVEEGRRLLGDEIPMLVDFGYRWRDWRSALQVLDQLESCDLYLAEATLRHDDLDGHAKLAARVATRVGGAEMAATRFECREWIERGGIDVLQPDVNRCGGLTEMVRIAELAELAGVLVVPHCWKTGITAAAARHLQAATTNVPFVEALSPELFDSPLRRELVGPEPAVVDGLVALPTAPGLGVDLDEDALAAYRVD
jgi:L-alanine-DL-glutamate epimerase-like enolase superfamily enzyme